eukprot:GGOE01045807.1.p3 GENE.GGOE01045807.1~~GGOE01045807.1.p3  ORF type:complete len:179 (-),score=38.31 GGOE01045807.1:353-889(-)
MKRASTTPANPKALPKCNCSSQTDDDGYPFNDFELIIRLSRELEHLLRGQFDADGRGLLELAVKTQAKTNMPEELLAKLKFIQTVRNELVHERGRTRLRDRPAVIQHFETVRHFLLLPPKFRRKQCRRAERRFDSSLGSVYPLCTFLQWGRTERVGLAVAFAVAALIFGVGYLLVLRA